jgi:chorismate mutase
VSASRDKTIKLWNTLGECKYTIGEEGAPGGEGAVKVFVRCRPPRENAGEVVAVTEGTQVTVEGKQEFCVDGTFGPGSSQEEVYGALRDQVEGFFDGYNSTLLLYGQTGSGKTHTAGTAADAMDGLAAGAADGAPGALDPSSGILPRFLSELFDFANRECLEWQCSISMVEIYKEEMRDLLDATPKSVKLYKNAGQVIVQGLSEERVCSLEQAVEVMVKGCNVRATGATNMNEHSSRSHAIVTVHLQQVRRGAEGQLWQRQHISSKFNFVDLAGSESMKKTQAEGQRAEELININKGLLQLALVIEQLAKVCMEGQNTMYVPYRDSKLTRYLEDSLGGNSRTCMIACISQVQEDVTETTSTLRYARQARNIKNRPTKNVTLDDTTQQLATLTSENSELVHQLAVLEQTVLEQKEQLGRPGEEEDLEVDWKSFMDATEVHLPVIAALNRRESVVKECKEDLKGEFESLFQGEMANLRQLGEALAKEVIGGKLRELQLAGDLRRVKAECAMLEQNQTLLKQESEETSPSNESEATAATHIHEMSEKTQAAWSSLVEERARMSEELECISRELSMKHPPVVPRTGAILEQLWTQHQCMDKLKIEREKQRALLNDLLATLEKHGRILGESLAPKETPGTPIVDVVMAAETAIKKAEVLIQERQATVDAYVQEVKSIAGQLGGCEFGDNEEMSEMFSILIAGRPATLGLSLELLGRIEAVIETLEAEKGRRAEEFGEIQQQLAQFNACILCADTEDIPDLKSIQGLPSVDGENRPLLTLDAMKRAHEEVEEASNALEAAYEGLMAKTVDVWGQVGKTEEAIADFKEQQEEMEGLDQFTTLHEEFRLQFKKMECLRPLLSKIQERQALVQKMAEFEKRASDPERLRSRSRGAFKELQEEENFRKKIKKQYPQLRRELMQLVVEYENLEGEHFLYQGERYRDQLESEDLKSLLLHLKTFPGPKKAPAALRPLDANSRAAPARPATAKVAGAAKDRTSSEETSFCPRPATAGARTRSRAS